MNLKVFIEQARLNWAEVYFSPDSSGGYSYSFGLRPEDFITYAKADFFKADTRGLVNALSNAKRAIDCQADCLLAAIGFNPEKLEKQLGKAAVNSLVVRGKPFEGPLKFRLLQALGVAAPSILARTRRLRNLLEHEYKKPRRKEVSDAIEIAELFLQACKGRMNSAYGSYSFGSGITEARGEPQVAREIYVWFDRASEPFFQVYFRDHEWIAKQGAGKSPSVKVRLHDDAFVPLLKLTWQVEWGKDMTEPLQSFLSELGFQLPRSRFRVLDGACL